VYVINLLENKPEKLKLPKIKSHVWRPAWKQEAVLTALPPSRDPEA